MKHRAWIFIAVVIAIIVIAFIIFRFNTKGFVPQEFSEARMNGAKTAQKIVLLSDSSLITLEEIATLEDIGRTKEALQKVSQELADIATVREEAIMLASQLERMAKLIPKIEPAEARIAATEAVSAEVALVSRLLSYNDVLLSLFELLKTKFEGKVIPELAISTLIERLNKEALAINEFNRVFNDAMDAFDKFF